MAINIHKIFSDALLELCKTRKLESITVKDLLDHTGVSRQSFYNRFLDKNALIQWTYENNVLAAFHKAGPGASYYINTLNYYKAIHAYRYFMKQAVQMRGQNCLRDFIYEYALEYDINYHKMFYGEDVLPDEFMFATWYHAAAAIDVAMQWIICDHPDPPEVMAARITNMRKISMSDLMFGQNHQIYEIPGDHTND